MFSWSLGKSLLVVLATMGAFGVVLHVLFIALWLGRRSGTGRLVLDCGQNPQKQVYLLIGAYMGFVTVLAFVGIVVAAFLGKRDLHMYILIALWIASTASFFLIMAFGRLQIFENGIWQYSMLFKWDRIESYDWQGGEEPKLMLKMQSRFFRRRELSFPLEQADAVDELLPKYVRIQQDDF
jgi:hypothetical protein